MPNNSPVDGRPHTTEVRSLVRTASLRAKAISLVLAAIGVVGVLAYFVFSPYVAKQFEREAQKRGDAMKNILEKHQDVRLALSLGDKERALIVAADVKSGDTDIKYVMLLDGQKRPLGVTGLAADEMANVIATHMRGNDEGGSIHRFTKEVKSEKSSDDSMGFAAGDDKDKAASGTLGWVLLGLSTETSQRQLTYQTFGTILVTAVVLVVVFLIFFRTIEQRLRAMAVYAERIAAGDLNTHTDEDSGDEIGVLAVALKEMAAKTGAVVSKMQSTAGALVKASTDILMSSRQQSERASLQAASVTETGATVTQLRQTFQQSTDRTQGVIELAKRSEDATTSGRRSVEQSVEAMQQLSDHVLAISRTMTGLVERTAQIASIIDTVNDLAEQSNVLALNAAIESAKAGEQGRGFAVVAREVRNLAERSKDSTGQVRAMLQDIERASREALTVIEEGNRKARAGMDLAEKAGESITSLHQAIGESSTAAKQIAASARQQGAGVEQIWQAMRDIDRAVKESASGIRALEEASTNITSLADQMGQLVSRYRVEAKVE